MDTDVCNYPVSTATKTNLIWLRWVGTHTSTASQSLHFLLYCYLHQLLNLVAIKRPTLDIFPLSLHMTSWGRFLSYKQRINRQNGIEIYSVTQCLHPHKAWAPSLSSHSYCLWLSSFVLRQVVIMQSWMARNLQWSTCFYLSSLGSQSVSTEHQTASMYFQLCSTYKP